MHRGLEPAAALRWLFGPTLYPLSYPACPRIESGRRDSSLTRTYDTHHVFVHCGPQGQNTQCTGTRTAQLPAKPEPFENCPLSAARHRHAFCSKENCHLSPARHRHAFCSKENCHLSPARHRHAGVLFRRKLPPFPCSPQTRILFRRKLSPFPCSAQTRRRFVPKKIATFRHRHAVLFPRA